MPRGRHASFLNGTSQWVEERQCTDQASEHCMAFQQAGNKGTLVPGQTIAVNKYTVQVERYLSQGLIVSTFRLAASVTTTDRRLCTRLPRQDSYRSVWNDTPCPQTHCSLK